MPRPWRKSWSSKLDNQKVMQLQPDLYKVWDLLCDVACRHDQGGELPTIRVMAFALHTRTDKLQEMVDQLVVDGLIDTIPATSPDHNTYTIHDWYQWNDVDRGRDDSGRYLKSGRTEETVQVEPTRTPG